MAKYRVARGTSVGGEDDLVVDFGEGNFAPDAGEAQQVGRLDEHLVVLGAVGLAGVVLDAGLFGGE